MRKNLVLLCCLLMAFCGFSQNKPVYPFWKDDSLVKKQYYEQARQSQEQLLASLEKKYRDDYTTIYKDRFREVGRLLESSRTVTAPEVNGYLQSLLQQIIDVNPELKALSIRLVFSRDGWPNAFSMGEGTLIVNAGLVVYLDNEAELIFTLCHELAHLYLDHGNKAIRQRVETVNSEEFKKEIKRLSKEQYRLNQQYGALLQKLTFDSRLHSREHEAEADRQAFLFMKKTGYDCNGIRSCLQLLDKVDDSLLFGRLDVERMLNFPSYPFKKKWTQKESMLFGELRGDESPLTKKEKDSLKTHPDCSKRIAMLEKELQAMPVGKKFIVDEEKFRRYKEAFSVEMAEQEYRDHDLGRNLYYALVMLQNEKNVPWAVYTIVRDLNIAYEAQKNHTLGGWFAGENRTWPEDYNLLLRILARLRLEEIAALNEQFCKRYESLMAGYDGFAAEQAKALKNNKP